MNGEIGKMSVDTKEKSKSIEALRERIDVEALRRKYREERDKRTSQDRGNYVYMNPELAARFDHDPWAKTDGSREPVSRDVEVLICGGGISGLVTGGTLRKNGLDPEDICIIDRGSDFGGTWYWARYPGLSCDTESFVYLPFLEETGYIPKEKYSKGYEIFEQCQRVGRHFDLYKGALFQTRIEDAIWDEDKDRWIVTTDRGDEIRARYMFRANSLTSEAKLPGVPGLDTFKGHAFHALRWDYDYTGGSPTDELTGLKDKRVAIVGTGATAIQAVPPLGEAAKELLVFQRTPSSVNIRANRPTDPEWAASLKPGWQRERMENFLNIISGFPEQEDMVDDGWTWSVGKAFRRFEKEGSEPFTPEKQELLDFETMNGIRDRVDQVVEDPQTAEALKPWYGIMCKRPCFHDGYLETFNRPNVTLVDTDGQGIERITENGIVAGGKEYEVDCIIFATGFDVSGTRWKGPDPKGANGKRLSERWRENLATLHGLIVPGFPNMFTLTGPGSTLATTVTYGFMVQAEHCARIINYCREHDIDRFEVKPEAAEAWWDIILEKSLAHKDYYEACTPGYYNAEGKGSVFGRHYGEGPVAYGRKLQEWADTRLTEDLIFD
ncbi:flavin-containing monooxygenase [Novosphingobium pentaromativorans]|uniref:Putative monooxygenase n=1 Tax=Novosphingobium pentaromativorans US6-1 TaxID=1088721 RepID=G6E7X3_9SPHN|nr:NAD(P)/FAD-dependent oxidoreductase [Novosphingobium pentaromativorans]AIT81505.1 monooxygenase [Novosphingobium pentaromativorans US6-1]EHJ62616.1 putative monooxygenase [Novosphingobium pentaromativorans US6-1]